MGTENRVPSSDPAPPRRGVSPPFFRVDREVADGSSRHYVVHTRSPKFIVEFEHASEKPVGGTSDKEGPASTSKGRRPVIRRVCVPNSWAGDYHQCAKQLGAAAEFFGATGEADA